MLRRDVEEYDDDDGSVVQLDIEADHSPTLEGEEEEYDNECGYFIVKMLRGTTLGREMKREVFILATYESVFGISIFLISVYEDQVFGAIDGYLTDNNYGGSILGMQFVCSIGALILASCGFLAIRYWSSLVTNRQLLGDILKLYQVILVIHFTICLWSLNALCATFKHTIWEV